jgi:hypothetical protein
MSWDAKEQRGSALRKLVNITTNLLYITEARQSGVTVFKWLLYIILTVIDIIWQGVVVCGRS